MFRLYKSDDSVVEFTTEEGAMKTLEAFPDKYFLSPSTKEKIKTIKNDKKKKPENPAEEISGVNEPGESFVEEE